MMNIGIDFDDTLVNTSEVVLTYMKRYGIKEFKNEQEKTKFYRQYVDQITKDLSLKEHALEVLNKWKHKYHFYLITARGDYYSTNLERLTLEFIKEHELPFENVYFRCYDKRERCLQLNIDIFIDDDIINCQAIHSLDIETHLFGNVSEGIPTIYSWKDVDKILEVHDGRKSSN